MDSIQTVAGTEIPAEATAADLEEQQVEVQAVDQVEAEAGELDTIVVEEDLVEAVPTEQEPAEAEGSEQAAEPPVVEESVVQEIEVLVDDEPKTEAEEPDSESQTEAEPDASEMGDMPMEDWDYQRPKRGEIRTGVILSMTSQEIVVDVGVKRDGIVPYSDIQRLGEEELAGLSEGDEVLVYVLRPEDQDGNLLLSLNMARQEKAWRRAQKMAESGEIWEGEVIGYNKGGLVIPVDEIRGFVPASQVPGFPQGLGQEERLQRLSDMVGQTLQVKVIEINRRKRRLILSATTAVRQWRKQQRERLLDELREGEVRTGSVSSVCSFGAFVDLGGADGLIHLSELSWRRVRHPREVLKVGEKVEVYVLRLDHEKKRIGLSLKRLQPEPWALVEDKYELGQLVEGVVTNVVDFGAFAEIEEGVEGLIHVSELAEAQVAHPKDVVKKGDLLLLRIIRIDVRRKRLGLSLKRVLESEWAEWAARLAVAEAEKAAQEAQLAAEKEKEVDLLEAEAEEEQEEAVEEQIEAEAVVAEAAEAIDEDAPEDLPGAEAEEEQEEAVEDQVEAEAAVVEAAEAVDKDAPEDLTEAGTEEAAAEEDEAEESPEGAQDEAVAEGADAAEVTEEPSEAIVEEAILDEDVAEQESETTESSEIVLQQTEVEEEPADVADVDADKA